LVRLIPRLREIELREYRLGKNGEARTNGERQPKVFV
jgi:hypothetical protein